KRVTLFNSCSQLCFATYHHFDNCPEPNLSISGCLIQHENISQLSTGWWVGMTVSTTRYEAGKQNCSSLNWKLIEVNDNLCCVFWLSNAILPLSNAVRVSPQTWLIRFSVVFRFLSLSGYKKILVEAYLNSNYFRIQVEVLCLPLAEATDLSVDDNVGTQDLIPTPPSMF
uniref:Uncharacterized protein n=1 Tax=Oryza glaberrima TaxID=4538 RepID=I1P6Y8_ORYGL